MAMIKHQHIVGDALARVLPSYGKPWYRVPHLLKLNLILLVPLISSASAGYDASLMNGLQATSAWKQYFGNPAGARLGLVNAILSVGSIVALPVAGILSDKIGRRRTLLCGIAVVIVAAALQAASVNYAMFVISRLLIGAGVIVAIQPSPVLISELAFPTHRAKYTSLFWTCYYLGAILSSWITFGTQKHIGDSSWAWRAPSLLQAACPIIQTLFWCLVPESPRWLIANGESGQARQIMAQYHTGGDSGHQLIEFEMAEITGAIEMEKQSAETKWSSLVSTPGNRRRTLICIFVAAFAQWNGVTVVSYYLTLVLDSVGVKDPDTQTLINGILQIFNFLAAVSAALLVDRLGRRTLFLWSGLGMLVSFVVWTASSATFEMTGSHAAGIVVIVFVFLYNFHYDIAYTPLLYGYMTEVLPYFLRAKGLAVGILSMHSSLFVLAFVNPVAIDNIGWRYYIVFCCLLAVMLVITWFLFPETKGHSLEEIREIFDGPDDLIEEAQRRTTEGTLTEKAISTAHSKDQGGNWAQQQYSHNVTVGIHSRESDANS